MLCRSAVENDQVDPDRRRILAASLARLASGIAFAAPFQSYSAETMTLRKLVAKKGLAYGAAISAASIKSDPEFADLMLHQAGLSLPRTT